MPQRAGSPPSPVRAAPATPALDDVRAAAAGDQVAFARLHARHARAVAGLLLARVPHREVDDLVQEVFLAAWRGLPRLDDPERFLPWLATIARRRAARWHRDRRPEPAPLPEAPEDGPDAPAVGSPVEAAEILACLAELPEAQREALTLRLVEGLSGPEIAALVDRSHDAVRVHLSRGMARLRELLSARGWP